MPRLKLKELIVPPIETFIHAGMKTPMTNQERALYFTIYLTASRVNEVLLLKKEDIQEAIGEDDIPITRFLLYTLKNRNHPYRIIPIPHIPPYDLMLQPLQRELDLISDPQARVFHQFTNSRNPGKNAYASFRKIKLNFTYIHKGVELTVEHMVNPHLLIHARVTHLATQAQPQQIKKLRGWSDLRPFSVYEHLSYTDLTDLQLKVAHREKFDASLKPENFQVKEFKEEKHNNLFIKKPVIEQPKVEKKAGDEDTLPFQIE